MQMQAKCCTAFKYNCGTQQTLCVNVLSVCKHKYNMTDNILRTYQGYNFYAAINIILEMNTYFLQVAHIAA